MFGIADFGAFCAAVIVFLALPGPGTFALLSATGQGGLRAGAAATAGLVLGDQVLLWLAVAGVAALLATTLPAVFDAVRWAGAAYLAWIGWRLLATRGDGGGPVIQLKPRHYARQALVITLLNPKAIVFYMAFFPQFINPASNLGLPTYGAMALTIFIIECLWCMALCAGADAMANWLRARAPLGRWLERLAGLCMIGFGLRLIRA